MDDGGGGRRAFATRR